MTPIDEIKALIAQKELFIFDLDGTLFNTLGDLAPAVNYAMTQFGLHTHSNDDVRTFIGNGSMNLIRRAVAANFIPVTSTRDMEKVAETLARENYSEEKIKKIHKVYSDFYWEHCIENTEPYEGVVELLQRFATSAGTRCAAMLTNKPVAPAQKILKKFGLENSFATYLCGDTTPERKPSPAGIYEILRQTGIAPEKAIMIGDDTPDVLAAKNAGIDCITLFEGFGKTENLLPLEPRYTAGHIKDFAEFIN
ncbi:HAD-IA family hydrolase [Fibrobacter sp. UBA4297]|uniref:HAD family hydrolase n=1 Tax=Fibrobacter sp. UBA4297 TaxID=1946536 RepID=UPI0025B873BA|nr:HAD-IA family hydrolase [Fibrobacter sp. UBA4297]